MKVLLLVLLSVSLVSSTCTTTNKTPTNEYTIKVYTMLPTLKEGDIVVVDTLAKEYTYGDIVRAEYVSDKMTFVDFYRIVGMEGDTVGLDDNSVIRNGEKYRSVYRGEHEYKGVFTFLEFQESAPNNVVYQIYKGKMKTERDLAEPVVVPSDHYYLLGDSRSLSIDSRFCGAVPADRIYGKVIEIKK